jgi:hypothetical protein
VRRFIGADPRQLRRQQDADLVRRRDHDMKALRRRREDLRRLEQQSELGQIFASGARMALRAPSGARFGPARRRGRHRIAGADFARPCSPPAGLCRAPGRWPCCAFVAARARSAGGRGWPAAGDGQAKVPVPQLPPNETTSIVRWRRSWEASWTGHKVRRRCSSFREDRPVQKDNDAVAKRPRRPPRDDCRHTSHPRPQKPSIPAPWAPGPRP